MAAMKRVKIPGYDGVYYIKGKSASGGLERIFYIRYRRNGKAIEEKVGRSIGDLMTPARASAMRALRIDGKEASNQERREAEIAAKMAEEGGWTVQKLWDEYKSRKAETKSLATDKSRYDKYLKGHLGHKEPPEILPLDVARLRSRLLKIKSPQTVKHVLALLMRIVNHGANHALCPPLSFKIQMPKVDNQKTEDLPPEQLKKLLDAIEQDENKAIGAMMKMALYSGMRRGELFKLEREDND